MNEKELMKVITIYQTYINDFVNISDVDVRNILECVERWNK